MGAGGESASRVPGQRPIKFRVRSFKSPAKRLGFFFALAAFGQMSYRLRDSYYKKAKQQGYRSRAAYKLLELQERFRILRAGESVVDLGAAPGGWLQVAAKLVGPSGKVLGVDLQPIEPLNQKNIIIVQGDIAALQTEQRIMEYLGRPTDSVISDVAPKLTGIRDTDEARSLELNGTALAVAKRLLRPGGNFLIKSFVSEELRSFSAELEKQFRSVQRTRPDASRKGSSEIYFFAKDYQPKPHD
jgi:23S rRNA (uridine2552-2'-O)-methyltransferase